MQYNGKNVKFFWTRGPGKLLKLLVKGFNLKSCKDVLLPWVALVVVRRKQVNSRAAAAAGPQLLFLAAAGIARDAIAALYFRLPSLPQHISTFLDNS